MPQGTFHIDTFLTNLSVQYRNQQFIAEEIFPTIPVDNRSNKYPVYGKEIFRKRDDLRSPGSEAKKTTWAISSDSYFCDGHALKDAVPREYQANADPVFDLLIDTTNTLSQQVLLNQEADLVTLLVAQMTGGYLSDQVGTKWNAANDPLSIIRAEMDVVAKRSGVRPNALAVSRPVWTAIRTNAYVIGLITGAKDLPSALVTTEQVKAILELDYLFVGEAVYDTANEGQAASLDWVWGANALLFYRAPAPGRRVITLGLTFLWKTALQQMQGSLSDEEKMIGAQFVERYYDRPTKSDIIEVHKYRDQKVIAKEVGQLFTNCI